MSDILIVCHQAELATQLTDLLKQVGFEVDSVNTIPDGEQSWQQERQPLLLLDHVALTTPGVIWFSVSGATPRVILLQDGSPPVRISPHHYLRLCGVIETPWRGEQVAALVNNALLLTRAVTLPEVATPAADSVSPGVVNHYDQELVEVILNAKREWQAIFDSVQELLLVVDRKGRVHRLNLAVQQLYQEPFAQLIGAVLSPDMLAILRQEENPPLQVISDFKLLNRSPVVTGQWEFGMLPLKTGEETETFLLSGRDVTERERLRVRQKELELELMHEARLSSVGLLASGLAHNLSTPIQGILGYTQLLQREYPDDERLNRLQTMSHNLKQIIENLMQKLRRDQHNEETLIDLNEILQEDLKFLEADLYYKHQIEKDFQFAPQLPLLLGIHGDFSQAIMNIVSNAVDSMFERQRRILTIRTSLQQDRIMLEVTDTGCGMTPEVQANIFTPFFTSKPTRNERVGEEPTGTGLGLASARHLLQKYNVIIKVASKPGEGSCFKLLFLHGNRSKQDSPPGM
ncbi:MAG: PAS domain-containing protein [Candidatus Delongbacteria bacterium]|nr:PAS domain-containing protein [bacterium]MBL7033123.1 PAS domain-containing protein [Candidatus Delongbacteria bacterium]